MGAVISALPGRDQQEILLLMAAVDTAFAGGHFSLGDELDARLEERLDELDHRLSDMDESEELEGGDVLDGDNHVGIEDQFIAAWSQVLSATGSFAPPGRDAELAAHLRSVLSSEALTGPCAPQPFLDVATDDDLLALAADLWNERQALILGTK
jgi:hypothetical protein